jgi:preprotein translocase subunit SecF
MRYHFQFVKHWRTWFALSTVLMLLALFGLFVRGLNYGIDFTGGTQMDLKFQQAVSAAQLSTQLSRFNLAASSSVVFVGNGHKEVLITTPKISESTRANLLSDFAAKVGKFQAISTSRVSSVIGQQTEQTALLAVLIAVVGIILYIAIRFEFRFAMAAIISLIHTVVIAVGLVALIHIVLTQYFVMAVLTVFGYAISDTIIIFDRIRENLQTMKRGDTLEDLVNASLNQVLTRSINTSSTVVFALLALLIFGGSTIQDFALTMLLGVVFGTYASIFIASPIWLLWRKKSAPTPRRRRAA